MYKFLFNDISEIKGYFHQDPSNNYSIFMEWFNLYIMLVLIFIFVYLIWIMIIAYKNLNYTKIFIDNPVLEFIWTIIPMVILIFIAVPSIYLLYETEDFFECDLTIKVVGNQWYWQYEYSDFFFENLFEFDSRMLLVEDLKLGDFRLREVDNNLIIPVNCFVRLLCSSNDVIHSFTIPSFGIKLDCLPGRLNQILTYTDRVGYFVGGCSEICGSEHGYMPVCLKVLSLKNFTNFINKFLNKNLNC